MSEGKTSRDIAEAIVRRVHPEAVSLLWIPRSEDPGSLEELHWSDGSGDLVPTGVLTVPWSVPAHVRRILP